MKRNNHAALLDNSSIDMTPMLDIVFIMLIFFIVTTSFVKEVGLSVNRPTLPDQTVIVDSGTSLSIYIGDDGSILLNGRAVDIQRIGANIQSFLAENSQDSAAVKAHPKAKHGRVTEVINEIKKAGIEHVAVLAGR